MLVWNKLIGLFMVYIQWRIDVKGKLAQMPTKVVGRAMDDTINHKH